MCCAMRPTHVERVTLLHRGCIRIVFNPVWLDLGIPETDMFGHDQNGDYEIGDPKPNLGTPTPVANSPLAPTTTASLGKAEWLG